MMEVHDASTDGIPVDGLAWKAVKYSQYFPLEKIVKFTCQDIYCTLPSCWLNCVISVQHLLNHAKNSFLVTLHSFILLL